MPALWQLRTPLCSGTWQHSSSFSLPNSMQRKKQKKGATWLLRSWGRGFFSACPYGELRRGKNSLAGLEWVSWGQCTQAYLLFPLLLFSCIACSDSFFHGDRLHSPALTPTRHLRCWKSMQRISIERSGWKSGFCTNSTSRLT